MTIVHKDENLFVMTKDRDSVSLGRISFDKRSSVCFIPTQGMSFTHQMLFELSQHLKNAGEAQAKHRES